MDPQFEDERVKVWVFTTQGGRRRMEDEYVVSTGMGDRSFLSVFDGHFGPAASRFCANYFLRYLLQDEAYKRGEFGSSLHRVYMQMDRIMRGSPELMKKLDSEAAGDDSLINETQGLGELVHWPADHPEYYTESNSGTTAVMALIVGEKLIVANAGDSFCSLVRGGKFMHLTVDHSYENPAEVARIKRAGGVVGDSHVFVPGKETIYGGLNVVRCLGDLSFKMNSALPQEEQIISAVPDIVELNFSEDDQYLVLASDGYSRYLLERDWSSIISSLQSLPTHTHWWPPPRDSFFSDNATLLIVKLKQTGTKLKGKASLDSNSHPKRISWFTENKIELYEPEDVVVKSVIPEPEPTPPPPPPPPPKPKTLWQSMLEGIPGNELSLAQKRKAKEYIENKFTEQEANVFFGILSNVRKQQFFEDLRKVGAERRNFCDQPYEWVSEFFDGLRGPPIKKPETRKYILEVIKKVTVDFFYYGKPVHLSGYDIEEIMETQLGLYLDDSTARFFEPICMNAAFNFLKDNSEIINVQVPPGTEFHIGNFVFGGWWRHYIPVEFDAFWKTCSGKMEAMPWKLSGEFQKLGSLRSEICSGQQEIVVLNNSLEKYLEEAGEKDLMCKFLVCEKEGMVLFRVRFEDGKVFKCAICFLVMKRSIYHHFDMRFDVISGGNSCYSKYVYRDRNQGSFEIDDEICARIFSEMHSSILRNSPPQPLKNLDWSFGDTS